MKSRQTQVNDYKLLLQHLVFKSIQLLSFIEANCERKDKTYKHKKTNAVNKGNSFYGTLMVIG